MNKSDKDNWNSLRGKAINKVLDEEPINNFKLYKYKIACIVENELKCFIQNSKFIENKYGKFIMK